MLESKLATTASSGEGFPPSPPGSISIGLYLLCRYILFYVEFILILMLIFALHPKVSIEALDFGARADAI